MEAYARYMKSLYKDYDRVLRKLGRLKADDKKKERLIQEYARKIADINRLEELTAREKENVSHLFGQKVRSLIEEG